MAAKRGNPNKDYLGRFTTGSSFRKEKRKLNSTILKTISDIDDQAPSATVNWSKDQKVFYRDIIKAFGKPNKFKKIVSKYNYKRR